MRHALAEEKRSESGIITTSKTDTRSYRITVKNLHERPITVTVLDQIPVSQNADIKVELTGKTAPTKRDVDDKRGVLAWDMTLEPDEERAIEFGYRATWPAAKKVTYGKGSSRLSSRKPRERPSRDPAHPLDLAAGSRLTAPQAGTRYRRGACWHGAGGAIRAAETASRTGVGRRTGGSVQMANVVVIGAQWGDEGKGKIVDWLSERADVVVRFQGGHNAGHTLVIGNQTYKLSLLPSGVVRPGKLVVIGNGVVVDPWALGDEIERLRGAGRGGRPRQPARRRERHPDPAAAPRARPHARGAAGAGKIGTTGRGIGPAYEDKVGRRAIRVQDLKNLDTLGPKVDRMLVHHNALRRGLGQPELDQDALMARAAPRSRRRSCPTSTTYGPCSTRERRAGKRILFEGAQGALLDVDHGTYPFVTSSNTVAAQAATGSGMGPARRSATCWASPRPTPRASAPGRSRPS